MRKKIPIANQHSCLGCDAREFAWFEKGTDKQLLERQEHRTSQVILEANDYLFMEGDPYQGAYTLKEGWMVCFKQLKDGRRQIIHVALPGDFIGYIPEKGNTIDYSCTALTDCRLCYFSAPDLNKLLLKDVQLIHRLIQIQNSQNQACRTALSYVGQSQAKHKVAYFLLEIIKRLTERGVDTSKPIIFPLSRIDIADAVGITPVHLGRVSVELSNENIVVCRHGFLNVVDIAGLEALV
ncbi:MAG: Crp/Fnr family transcriptional regulator [Thiotrichaceae bacterium]|nr:Crp/Fnr family transcriptional regulator [Thiotrichaceae bacterium]